MKTAGDKVFPYVQENVDEIITIEDDELVDAFLDMMEKHKMIVENSGLLTIAALNHIDCKGKCVVPILSGGNMDVITMSQPGAAWPDSTGAAYSPSPCCCRISPVSF